MFEGRLRPGAVFFEAQGRDRGPSVHMTRRCQSLSGPAAAMEQVTNKVATAAAKLEKKGGRVKSLIYFMREQLACIPPVVNINWPITWLRSRRPSDPQPPKPGAAGHQIRGRIHRILHDHDKEVRSWGRHLAETSWPPGPSRANGTSMPWIHRRLVVSGLALRSSSPGGAWQSRGEGKRGMRRGG